MRSPESAQFDIREHKYILDTWLLANVLSTITQELRDALEALQVQMRDVYTFFFTRTCYVEVAMNDAKPDSSERLLSSQLLWFVKPVVCDFLTNETKHEVRCPLLTPVEGCRCAG